MSRSDRSLPGWVLPAGIGVVVVVLVAIALSRGPMSLDPDTPEGTVQEYLVAISEERWDDAIEIVHEDTRGDCEGSDLAAVAREDFTAELGGEATSADSGVREPVDVSGETTRVDVVIRRNETGALGTGWSENVAFQLVEDEEFWWLTGEPWPYFTWNCGEGP